MDKTKYEKCEKIFQDIEFCKEILKSENTGKYQYGGELFFTRKELPTIGVNSINVEYTIPKDLLPMIFELIKEFKHIKEREFEEL